MILGSICELDDEAKSLPKALQEAVCFLKEQDFSKLESKKYPVKDYDLNDIFMLVQEYKTKPASEKNAEQHKRFIDIHYVVSGREAIGMGAENLDNKMVSEYSAEKDCALYSFVKDERFLALKPGQYLICFPADIHRPGCTPEGENECDVKKIVIKIDVKLLSD